MASVKLIIPATPWPKLTTTLVLPKPIVRQSFQRPVDILNESQSCIKKRFFCPQTKHLALHLFHDALNLLLCEFESSSSACCNNGLRQGMLRSSVWQYRPAVLHGWFRLAENIGNDWSSIWWCSGFVHIIAFILSHGFDWCILLPEPLAEHLSRHWRQQEWRLQVHRTCNPLNVMVWKFFQP
jgi:hypothetical protein